MNAPDRVVRRSVGDAVGYLVAFLASNIVFVLIYIGLVDISIASVAVAGCLRCLSGFFNYLAFWSHVENVLGKKRHARAAVVHFNAQANVQSFPASSVFSSVASWEIDFGFLATL